MKKQLFIILFTFVTLTSYSQIVPEAFKYQAVVRDNAGAIIPLQTVKFRLTIQKTANAALGYQETHIVTTNAFGLVSLEIGSGTPLFSTFSNVAFDTYKFSLKVEVDPLGGNSFTLVGTSPLVSVPYAHHAKTAEDVDDADANPTNEIQSLNLLGNNLSISSGNTVTLPSSPWTDAGGEIYRMSNVGIGINNPTTELDVVGTIKATNFSGDGSALTNVVAVRADSLSGSMQANVGDVLEWDGTKWAPVENPKMAFHAFANVSQSIPALSSADIAFPHTALSGGFDDTGGAYDAATGVFTAPANGVYHFEAQVTIGTIAGTGYVINLMKNGGFHRTNGEVNNGSSAFNAGLNISAILKLNAGDTIKISCYNGAPSARSTYSFGARYTYFSGYRIY